MKNDKYNEDKIYETISICQMNTLAKSLCDKKSFPKVNEEYLTWEYRSNLMKEIFINEIHDIYTLEEVEEISDYLIFFDKKYKNVYQKKLTGAAGGIALIYNSEKFECVESLIVNLPQYEGHLDSSQFSLVALLKNLSSDEIFMIVVNHLKSKQENEGIRLYQISFLIKYINEYKFNYSISGVLFTGDLNAYPNSSTLDKIRESEFIKFKLSSCFEYLDEKNEFYLDFTSCKFRDKVYISSIDYIFYSDKFKKISAKRALSMCNKDEILKEFGLPSKEYPSDHLYITAKFNIY